MFGIAAHILERQHCDGGLVRQREWPVVIRWRWSGARSFRGCASCAHRKGANWLLNVLDLLRAKVSERKGQNFSDLIVSHSGDAGAACAGERLQPCSDVDAITKEVAALYHDVADVDADPEVDVTVRRQVRVSFGKYRLRLDSALNGIDGAAELREHAIAGGVSYPAPVGGNQAIKDGAPLGQSLERLNLVGPHQAAIALNVSRKNRDQPALGINRFRQN